jgi:TRAP-type C4-dicarboxylate transport system permease small subunit
MAEGEAAAAPPRPGSLIARALLRLCEASALASALALLFGMAVVLVDILTRRLIAAPLTGVNDLVQLAVVATACLAFPLAFARRAHVVVEFLTDRFPAPLRHWLFRAVALVEAALLVLLLLYGWNQFENRLALGDVSSTLGLPVALYWAPYLFGIGLSVPAALLPLLRVGTGPDAGAEAGR